MRAQDFSGFLRRDRGREKPTRRTAGLRRAELALPLGTAKRRTRRRGRRFALRILGHDALELALQTLAGHGPFAPKRWKCRVEAIASKTASQPIQQVASITSSHNTTNSRGERSGEIRMPTSIVGAATRQQRTGLRPAAKLLVAKRQIDGISQPRLGSLPTGAMRHEHRHGESKHSGGKQHTCHGPLRPLPAPLVYAPRGLFISCSISTIRPSPNRPSPATGPSICRPYRHAYAKRDSRSRSHRTSESWPSG